MVIGTLGPRVSQDESFLVDLGAPWFVNGSTHPHSWPPIRLEPEFEKVPKIVSQTGSIGSLP